MRSLLLVVVFFLISVAAHAAPPQPFAKVLYVEGFTSLEPGHTNLATGMLLSEGDRISVMASSKLRLKLKDGAVIEIGPHSELLLKQNADRSPILRLPHGEILAVSKGNEELEVRTGLLSLKFRANAFFVNQQLDQPAYICVCEGKANAKWPMGKATIVGRHHDHPMLIYTSKPLPVPSHRQHEENDLNLLRKLL